MKKKTLYLSLHEQAENCHNVQDVYIYVTSTAGSHSTTQHEGTEHILSIMKHKV
jgi:hypothetical protein